MAIRKAKQHTQYAQIPNSTLRDKSLSFEARGVLAMLLSLPEDWSVNIAWICNQSGSAGRDKVSRILKELQQAGYMIKRPRQGEGGKMDGVDWDVYLDPVPLENRITENPSYGESATTNKELNKEREIQSNTVRKKRTTKPDAFKQFYDQYPSHRKGGTDAAAWKKWKAEKLTDQDAEMALSWVMRANAVAGWSESRFVMGIVNFIGQRMWLTDVEKIANEISTAASQKNNQRKLTPVEQVRAAHAEDWEQWSQSEGQHNPVAEGHGDCLGADGGHLRGSVDQQEGREMQFIELEESDWRRD